MNRVDSSTKNWAVDQ